MPQSFLNGEEESHGGKALCHVTNSLAWSAMKLSDRAESEGGRISGHATIIRRWGIGLPQAAMDMMKVGGEERRWKDVVDEYAPQFSAARAAGENPLERVSLMMGTSGKAAAFLDSLLMPAESDADALCVRLPANALLRDAAILCLAHRAFMLAHGRRAKAHTPPCREPAELEVDGEELAVALQRVTAAVSAVKSTATAQLITSPEFKRMQAAAAALSRGVAGALL